MARWLEQSQSVTIRLGPFLDEDDGKSAENSLTISQADVRLSKNHGAFAQKNDATSATNEENGWYQVPLNATDTGTLGPLTVAVHESGALPVWEHFMVVPSNVYDSLVGGTDTLNADVTQWNGSSVATPDSAGHPVVTVKDGTGAGEINVTSGVVDSNLVQMGGTAQSATDLKDFADAGYDPGTNYITGIAGTHNTLDDLNDVWVTDTFAEPGQETPAVPQTMKNMLAYLYKCFVNKKDETASLWQLYNNAGDTVHQKATISDDGTTTTKANVVSGP